MTQLYISWSPCLFYATLFNHMNQCWNSHVTLGCIYAVVQGLYSHPANRQPSLKAKQKINQAKTYAHLECRTISTILDVWILYHCTTTATWWPPVRNTHHCLLHVNFLTTGQAEVCYFCHKVVAYENIPGCQIPVDKLMSRKWRIHGEAAMKDFILHLIILVAMSDSNQYLVFWFVCFPIILCQYC